MTEPRASQVEVIEPLRGIAALSVAYFHFTNRGLLVQSGWLKASGALGWLGVEVFFVISGFIIPYALYHARYRPTAHIGRFILKRAIRLDPPYFAAIAVAVLLWNAKCITLGFQCRPQPFEALQLLSHVGYLNDIVGYPWIIPVFWTLAIEFQFYLLCSLSFPLIAHPHSYVRLSFLGVACASAFLMPEPQYLFRYMGLFALGILTFTKYVGIASLRSYLVLLVPCVVITGVTLGTETVCAGLLTALIIAFVRVARIAPLAFLGSISYSIYLLHAPIGGRIVNLGAQVAHDTVTQVAVLATAIGATIAASYLMYRFVERPARKWSASIRYSQQTMLPESNRA